MNWAELGSAHSFGETSYLPILESHLKEFWLNIVLILGHTDTTAGKETPMMSLGLLKNKTKIPVFTM